MAETLQQKVDRLVEVAVRTKARHQAELAALGVPLGPDGRPDCGYCAECRRVNVGLVEENRQLRQRMLPSSLVSDLVHDLMGSAKFALLGDGEPRLDDDQIFERFEHVVQLHLGTGETTR